VQNAVETPTYRYLERAQRSGQLRITQFAGPKRRRP
jgi:hypothetical protein